MVKDSDFLPNSDIEEYAEEGVSSDESYYSFESDTEYPERKIKFGSSNSIPKEVRKGGGILGKFERLPKTDICYIYFIRNNCVFLLIVYWTDVWYFTSPTEEENTNNLHLDDNFPRAFVNGNPEEEPFQYLGFPSIFGHGISNIKRSSVSSASEIPCTSSSGSDDDHNLLIGKCTVTDL